MALEDIDPRNTSEQRKFGFLLAAVFFGITAAHYVFKGQTPMVLLALASLLFLLALIAPAVLGPILAAWLRLAMAINWFVTRVLLSLVFFGMIAPTAMILRLLRKDPLNRAWDSESETYWEDAEEQPKDPEEYLEQAPHSFFGTAMALGGFLLVRKRFWLAPIVITLLILSLFMLLAGSAGVLSPFLYMM